MDNVTTYVVIEVGGKRVGTNRPDVIGFLHACLEKASLHRAATALATGATEAARDALDLGELHDLICGSEPDPQDDSNVARIEAGELLVSLLGAPDDRPRRLRVVR